MKQSSTFSIKGNVRTVLIVTYIILAVMIIVSVLGILNGDVIYSEEIRLSFIATDVANLIIGVPYLIISLVLACNERNLGLILLPGALLYVIYVYLPYVIAVQFGILFILWLILIVLAFYALIFLLTMIDMAILSSRIQEYYPIKWVVCVLAGLGTMILVRQTGLIVTALKEGNAVAMTDISLWIDDGLLAPALILMSFLLWRRQAFGYVCSSALLIMYALLSMAVVVIFIYQRVTMGDPMDIAGVIILLIMSLICLGPFLRIIKGMK